MDTNAPAFYLASAAEAKRPCPRYGQCPVAQCLLCCARPAFSVCGSCATLSILSEVKPLTGEPDAGEPPVRFGGRGNHSFSLPLLWGGGAASERPLLVRPHHRALFIFPISHGRTGG